jgi:hypothetical protein
MKKLWILLAAGLLLACTCSTSPLVPFTPTPLSPTPLVHTAGPLNTNGLTVVRLQPQNGDLAELLHAEAPKAAALEQHMFVEFDASW